MTASEEESLMTMTVQEMLRTHPIAPAGEALELARCIEECFACTQSCTACADACLGEDDVAELRRCIATNLDCADVCVATGRVMTRQTDSIVGLHRTMLETCADVCRTCAEECERHADHHDHCRVCAEACRRCEDACRAAMHAL
jgi:Domain of Unknown Function (DUF326)